MRPMTRRGRVGLGILAIAMINVAAIVSARNLPVMAEYGWSMLALFAISILVFLVPISMAAAELGTGWPRDGGVYAWVKEAFGPRTGFLAVWCDYSENIAWFPTVLSFIAASLAYAINPALATEPVYLLVVMLVIFWGTTLLNLRGVRASAAVGAIGTVAGSILPRCSCRARCGVPAGRQPVADPVLPGSAGARPGAQQPGLPRRDHPVVHRHGDGRVPRQGHP
jgi:amino acid transporter